MLKLAWNSKTGASDGVGFYVERNGVRGTLAPVDTWVNGGGNDVDVTLAFCDSANDPPNLTNEPVNGKYYPDSSLSDLNGLDLVGDWNLEIYALFGALFLKSFCVTITHAKSMNKI
mmetsp:Transcript_26469/g.40088  ORF Transcript_26469/g.40088 Transcript_26469/m.40088 type:complete len:116 (+) Transcript_26469:22-369(+)